MSINFDNKDDRMGYLNEKMDDLLDGINEQYGKALFDELIVRLKNTVVDFNKEVKGMTNQLKSSTDKRSQLIEKIKLSIDDDNEEEAIEEPETEPAARELTEWEKRLESLENNR
tara:strand:+ start:553 stop:894 length:342 start_codon:yes stop_codon:yes gene_type:complete